MEEDLVNGRVYRLDADHLTIGVWDEDRGGYVGIRPSRDQLYLEYDVRYGGSAAPTQALSIHVPEGMPLKEILGMKCVTHDRYVERQGKIGQPGSWVHYDDGTFCDGERVVARNLELLEFLKDLG